MEHELLMPSKLIKSRHHEDTQAHKRRGVFSPFFDPRTLKYRKLDPDAVQNFRENIARANQSVSFGKMTPDASDIIPVNTVIGTVAKGSVLQMLLKNFYTVTSATSTCESSFLKILISSSHTNFPLLTSFRV